MTLRFRLVLSVAALAMAPLVARAGPIEWSYTIKTDTIDSAPWLYLGTVGRWAWSPETGEYFESHRFYTSWDEREISGSLSGSMLSTYPNDTVVVAGISYPETRIPADEPIDLLSDPAIRVAFMITDAASGESGEAVFEAEPYVMDGVYWTGTGVTGWMGISGPRSLVLGGNVYKITLKEQLRESWTPLIAEVEVAGVPEPSTLALGAVGLAVLARLRRRW